MCNRIWDMNPFKSSNPLSVSRDQKYLVALWQAVSVRLVVPDRFLLPRSLHNQSASSIWYWLQGVHGHRSGIARCSFRLVAVAEVCMGMVMECWRHQSCLSCTLGISSSVFPMKEYKAAWMSTLLAEYLEVENSWLRNFFWDWAGGVCEMLTGFNIDADGKTRTYLVICELWVP